MARVRYGAVQNPHLLSLFPDELSFKELGHIDEEGGYEGGSNEDGEVKQRRVASLPNVVLKGVPDNHHHLDRGVDDDNTHDGDEQRLFFMFSVPVSLKETV